MKVALWSLVRGVAFVGVAAGCTGVEPWDAGQVEAEETATVEEALAPGALARFSHELRVLDGGIVARNICELTIALDGSVGQTVTGSGFDGSDERTLTWWGGDEYTESFSISSSCGGPPWEWCDLTARWEAPSYEGTAAGCTLVIGDGTSWQIVGSSSGTALTVFDGAGERVIVRQDQTLYDSGIPSSAGILLRYNESYGAGVVSNYDVAVDGASEFTLPGPTVLGGSWPHKLTSIGYGVIRAGEAAGWATLFKHVLPHTLDAGMATSFQAAFDLDGSTPVFDVNISTPRSGPGLTLTREVIE